MVGHEQGRGGRTQGKPGDRRVVLPAEQGRRRHDAARHDLLSRRPAACRRHHGWHVGNHTTRTTFRSISLARFSSWRLRIVCVCGCADYVNANLTEFTRELVETYSNLPWVDTACGYGCSDHASWHKMGYRATMPAEAKFRDSNPCALLSLLSLSIEDMHLTRARDRHSHGGGHARSREPCTRPGVRQDRSRSHCRARSHRVHELGRVEQQHSPLLSHISLSLSLSLSRVVSHQCGNQQRSMYSVEISAIGGYK